MHAQTFYVNKNQNNSLRAGFEPTREDPIGFQVQRLNHSAIAAAEFHPLRRVFNENDSHTSAKGIKYNLLILCFTENSSKIMLDKKHQEFY